MTPSARLTAIARAITQRRSVADMRSPEPIDIDDCGEVYGDNMDPSTLTFKMEDLDNDEGRPMTTPDKSSICTIGITFDGKEYFIDVAFDGELVKRLGPFPDRDFALLAVRHIESIAKDVVDKGTETK